MAQGTLQRRPYLHVAEFGNSKVQVLQSPSPLPGVVLEFQLGSLLFEFFVPI